MPAFHTSSRKGTIRRSKHAAHLPLNLTTLRRRLRCRCLSCKLSHAPTVFRIRSASRTARTRDKAPTSAVPPTTPAVHHRASTVSLQLTLITMNDSRTFTCSTTSSVQSTVVKTHLPTNQTTRRPTFSPPTCSTTHRPCQTWCTTCEGDLLATRQRRRTREKPATVTTGQNNEAPQ
ncbi:hypothetical protein BD413DRAFT_198232 [Trametes elegans]|nr:hypothetical protein BD413DRAFT_198232 [Trametes elegans]